LRHAAIKQAWCLLKIEQWKTSATNTFINRYNGHTNRIPGGEMVEGQKAASVSAPLLLSGGLRNGCLGIDATFFRYRPFADKATRPWAILQFSLLRSIATPTPMFVMSHKSASEFVVIYSHLSPLVWDPQPARSFRLCSRFSL
jgi:hypothetical protein